MEQTASKNQSKSNQNLSKTTIDGSWVSLGLVSMGSLGLGMWFRASGKEFCSILEANLGPSWALVGAKLAAKSDPYQHVLVQLILEWIFEPLGVDFGSFRASKFSSETILNLRGPKSLKYYYLQYETQFFHVPGYPKIDEKSVPRRSQH